MEESLEEVHTTTSGDSFSVQGSVLDKKADSDVGYESTHTTHDVPSLAEAKKRHAHPVRWIIAIALILVAMIVPYWIGRNIAFYNTDQLVGVLRAIDPRGLAVISWLATVATGVGVGLLVAFKRSVGWKIFTLLAFSAVQFLSGFALLKADFWYSTFVVFQEDAIYPNAINLGIIAAAIGFCAFAVAYVAILIIIKKDSKLNVLTQGSSALALFLFIELVALGIVIFGGLINLFS